MLAYYTTNAFATGSKNSLAFQLRGIKQNRCTSPDVMAFMGSKDMLCSVATLNIGLEDRLAQLTIEESATGFKKSLAFQPHGIKQSRGSSGEGIWITKRQPGSACTSPDVEALMGSKDTLCKVVMLNIGLEDMLACFTVVASFKKMLAFQPRASSREQARQARASGSTQGLEDMLAHFAMEESAAGIKQSRGSTSE